MTSYRPIDSKREEFRKYLEKAGALDALSKVLVMLYDEPEKPADALDYIRKHLGDSNRPDEAELNLLKSDLEEYRLKIQTLEDEIKVLKERLAQHEPQEAEAMEEVEGAEPPAAGGETTEVEASHSPADDTSAAGSQPAPQ